MLLIIRVRVRAPQKYCVRESRQRHIFGKVSISLDKARILAAPHTCPKYLRQIYHPPLHFRRRLRRLEDRLYNILVARAPAQVPRDSPPHLLLCGIWILFQKPVHLHDDSRGAESTLQPMIIPKFFLERMSLFPPLRDSRLSESLRRRLGLQTSCKTLATCH